MTRTSEPGPLSGFVILDLSRVLSGPYCTMILHDLGATVVKVEHPEGGDEARQFLPFIDGKSAYFAAINRGKKSIALDLNAAADRSVFEQLLARADVLVENFRPGAMDKLGYGWSALQSAYPQLVFASISGFGQDGPYRNRGAYDLVVQAMSGMMSITGHPEAPPTRAGTSIGDLAASVFAATGIQAALLQRSRTGTGCRVDISMLDCQIALLESAIARFAATGVAPGPLGARHSGTAAFDAFKAADGYLVITAGGDELFRRLMRELGRPELCSDARFAERAARVTHQAELKTIIESCLAAAPVAQWLVRFERAGVPAGPINDIAAMVNDEHVRYRGVLAPIESAGEVRFANTPVLMSTRAYPTVLPPAPQLDEHRAEILCFAQGQAPLS
ncbi:MAG TPA: CoA transferase [Burkholderiaceae bacterium]|nr:CoA transferase [Burkholderiaceae bacterium]